jgi:hypothetical protein
MQTSQTWSKRSRQRYPKRRKGVSGGPPEPGSSALMCCSILVLAADISPMDIISHLPGLGEEYKVPYVFVASKEELGHASSTKRPTSCVMICPNMKRRKPKEKEKKAADKMDEVAEEEDDDYRELYDEIREEIYSIVSLRLAPTRF